MQVTDAYSGLVQEFPEGTSPEIMRQHFNQRRQQPLAGQIAGMFAGAGQQATDYAQTPTAPNIQPMVGLGMQGVQTAVQSTQRSNEFKASEAIRQRVQRDKQIEAIKDQEHELKLQETQFKYQQKVEAFRQKQADARAKMQAEADVAKEEAKQKGLTDREKLKPQVYNEGDTVVFPDGTSQTFPKTFAPQRPVAPRPPQVREMLGINPDTGAEQNRLAQWNEETGMWDDIGAAPDRSRPVQPKPPAQPSLRELMWLDQAKQQRVLEALKIGGYRDEYGDETKPVPPEVMQQITAEAEQWARGVLLQSQGVQPGSVAADIADIRDMPSEQYQPSHDLVWIPGKGIQPAR